MNIRLDPAVKPQDDERKMIAGFLLFFVFCFFVPILCSLVFVLCFIGYHLLSLFCVLFVTRGSDFEKNLSWTCGDIFGCFI